MSSNVTKGLDRSNQYQLIRVHGFLVLSSGVPNATQGSVISKTVWIAKTTATIAAPNIAEAVETVETVETVWGQ